MVARAATARARTDHPTVARLFEFGRGFWIRSLDGTYEWQARTVTTGHPKADEPDYQQTGSTFAWPVHHRDAVAAEFAKLAALGDALRWNRTHIVTLKEAFDARPGGASAADWVSIASVGVALRNHAADVAHFARLADRSRERKLALAGLYDATESRRSAAQWAEVAAVLTDDNDVAAFARVPATWGIRRLVPLAEAFAENAGPRNATQWTALAVAHRTLIAHEGAVVLLARNNWAARPAKDFIDGASAAGAADADLVRVLETTPRAVRGLLAMADDGWSHRDLGTFAGTLLSTPKPAGTTGAELDVAIGDFVSRPKIGAALRTLRPTWDPNRSRTSSTVRWRSSTRPPSRS